MSVSTFAEPIARLREATTNLVWRQWAALGAQVSAPKMSDSIVDPEALLLVTLALVTHERRLADVLASWVTVHSSLLSIQRLKNLRDGFPQPVRQALAAVAAIGQQSAKDARWASLATATPTTPLAIRGNKLRAGELRFTRPATLMLQLRQGMGVGVKADVLTYLLGIRSGGDWASTTAIAHATSYTNAAVRRAADDLAAAHFIRTLETVDAPTTAQRMYIAEPTAWNSVLQIGNAAAPWRSWRERFAFVAAALAEVDAAGEREVSAYAASVIARELLEGHRATLTRDRIADPGEFAATDFAEGDEWVPLFEKVTQRLGKWMDDQN